jgi:hypothetical protein
MIMNEDQKLSFLKDEYLKLQDQYEDFDRRSLTIKGWVSAGSIAAVALGLDPQKSGGGLIWLLIMSFALCFWYLEARWKLFQYALQDRIRIIEAHFRDEQEIIIKNPEPFQIYSWWFKSYVNDKPIYVWESDFRPRNKRRRLKSAALQDFVMLPYSLIIFVALIGLSRDLFMIAP